MPVTIPSFTALPNVGSQIERAIAAYFVSAGIGDTTNNHVTNDNTDRVAPLNDILAHSSSEEVPNSRIEAYQVRISSEFPAASQPGDAAGWNWQQINSWTGKVMAVMSFRNDGDRDFRAVADLITACGRDLATTDPTNNADMSDFTCSKVIYKGAKRAGTNAAGALVFVEQRNFEIHAVCANVD